MSEFSQGEGWWQASDGKWYPPEAAPPGFAAPTSEVPTTQPFGPPPGVPPIGAPAPMPTSSKSGLGTGPIVAIVVAVVLVIGAIVFFATSGDSKKTSAIENQSSSSSASSSSSSASRSSSSTGARPSSSGAPDVVAPAGFTVFSDDKDAFALAVPSEFEIADLSSGDPDRALSDASAKNPAFSNFDSQIRNVINNHGKMFAVDLSGDGFADNLTVIEAPQFDTTSTSGKASLKSQIESFGGSNVVFATQTIHGRKVLTATYDLSITASDGSQRSAFGGQAYVPEGSSVWILTLTSATPAGSDFDTIVQTFDVNA